MVDIFARLEKCRRTYRSVHVVMPTDISRSPNWRARSVPTWFSGAKDFQLSLNNHLGLANHPEVRKADAEGAAKFVAAPMGACMMSGQTVYHEQLERELAEFVGKEDAFLLNFGYQGMISIIDCLLTPRDVVAHDAEAHAQPLTRSASAGGRVSCTDTTTWIRCVFQLQHATTSPRSRTAACSITEGVLGEGRSGQTRRDRGAEEGFQFRLLVDDAHGGTMGEGGRGTASHFGVTDGVDVLFNTRQVDGRYRRIRSRPRWLVNLLRYNMRSQPSAVATPRMPMVMGAEASGER